MKPLTLRQQGALILADQGLITTFTASSMPSLHGRGLIERVSETRDGRVRKTWRVTDAGRAEAERLRHHAGRRT